MTVSIVVVDANILFSRTLRDYFLYAADEGAIEIHWSQQILDEMSRNLRKQLGLSHTRTTQLEQLMNDYIDYALIEVDPDDLSRIETVQMDAKDRHVLAGALSVGADVLLTKLAESFPDKMRMAHEMAVRYSRRSEAEVLSTLERIVGATAADAIKRHVNSTRQEGP